MNRTAIAISGVVLALTACTSDRPLVSGLMVTDRGFVTTDGGGKDTGDRNTTIVAWNANNNVALFDGRGQGCFEAAAAFKSQDRETGLSATLPKLLGESGDVNAVNRVLENVKLLSDKDNAVTFLDTALSNICIIAMNQLNHKVDGTVLKREDLIELIKYSIDNAVKLGTKQAQAQVDIHRLTEGQVQPGKQPDKPQSPTVASNGSPKAVAGK
ncbi:hypothetical protein HT749_27690 [Burkholderia cepacia]|uniref:hypothetical protein n=1 Tax=Burkholderia cepacia TaxID=292 RepID=UPI00157B732F|nr:hypothetical protein [Burkholderia cepacia]NTX47185.1 hypothetical protein [Burkholderia cepacia]